MHHRPGKIPIRTAGLILFAVLLAVACGGPPPAAESSVEATLTPPPLASKTVAPASTVEPSATEPEADNSVDTMAKAELALRIGVPVAEISVLSAEAVDWPDASLGCPQPDMMYAQVITPGYRVVLEVEGQTYEVHTGSGQSAVLCEEEGSAMEVPPVPGTVEAGLEPLIDMAREDLAERLSVPADEIGVLEAKAVVWPDASLGCPQPGMAYAQVLQDGLLIRLGAEGRMYFYHSGGGGEPFLCKDTAQMIPQVTPKYDELVSPPGSETD